jgi:hypothetical protein
LGLVYYASSSLNLKAGADVIVRVGDEKPSEAQSGEDAGQRFSAVEAGFSIGIGYSF